MYSFLLTLEGRRRIAVSAFEFVCFNFFQLGGQLATTVEINHKKYMWPYSQVFSVRDLPKPTYGRHLSNVLQPVCSKVLNNLTTLSLAIYRSLLELGMCECGGLLRQSIDINRPLLSHL